MPKKKPQKPDINKDPADRTEQVSLAFQALIASPGWSFLVEIIEGNLDVLEQQILDKADRDGNPLDEVATDRLRDKRGYLIELRGIPSKFIKAARVEPVEPREFDPYHTDAKHLRST